MRFSRLLRKIGQADSRELKFRLRRMLRIWQDRSGRQPHDLSFQAHLRQQLQGAHYREYWEAKENFLFTAQDREALLHIFRERFPNYIPSVIARAEEICRLRIPLFGEVIAFTDLLPWTRDPLTGRPWPMQHWSRLDVVGGTHAMDAKWVWELNRHQYLLPVAIAFWATGEQRYGAFVCDQLESWIGDNPPGHGINWVESQEIALRLVTWTWLLELLRGCRSLTDARLKAILDSLVRQAAHVRRYPSFYISPNTHLIGEAFGLYFFSSFYPELSLSDEWKAFSEKVLVHEFALQVGEDGVHRELSTYYHCYAADYFAQYLLLAERSGSAACRPVAARLGRMFDFLSAVLRPDGSLPMFGDGDGGRLLPLSENDYARPASLLWFGALLSGAPPGGVTEIASDGLIDAVWLFGSSFRERLQGLAEGTKAGRMAVFRQANIATYVFGAGPRCHQLIVNGGKMGFLSAGHSHADYLHFELSLWGVPVLVDPGTYSYKDPRWRHYCRSTASHNCVVIDGRDQCLAQGNFGWRSLPAPATMRAEAGSDCFAFSASHDCYAGIEHRRHLTVVEDQVVVCTDHFLGASPHDYLSSFHLAPGIEVEEGGGNAYRLLHPFGAGGLLFFSDFTDATTELVSGSDGSTAGWHFPGYGRRQRTRCLRVSERAAGEHIRHALIFPLEDSRNAAAILCRCSRSSGEDRIELTFHEKKIIYRYFHSAPERIEQLLLTAETGRIMELYARGVLQKILLFDTLFVRIGETTLVPHGKRESIVAMERAESGSWRATLSSGGQWIGIASPVPELNEHCMGGG